MKHHGVHGVFYEVFEVNQWVSRGVQLGSMVSSWRHPGASNGAPSDLPLSFPLALPRGTIGFCIGRDTAAGQRTLVLAHLAYWGVRSTQLNLCNSSDLHFIQ